MSRNESLPSLNATQSWHKFHAMSEAVFHDLAQLMVTSTPIPGMGIPQAQKRSDTEVFASMTQTG